MVLSLIIIYKNVILKLESGRHKRPKRRKNY